jgi:3-oxoacyl-[acyl-carrier-protein] synthase III
VDDEQVNFAESLRNTISNEASYAEVSLAGTQSLISAIRTVLERNGADPDRLDRLVVLSMNQALIEAQVRNIRSALGELESE